MKQVLDDSLSCFQNNKAPSDELKTRKSHELVIKSKETDHSEVDQSQELLQSVGDHVFWQSGYEVHIDELDF